MLLSMATLALVSADWQVHLSCLDWNRVCITDSMLLVHHVLYMALKCVLLTAGIFEF